jgi:predicted amidohydrolase
VQKRRPYWVLPELCVSFTITEAIIRALELYGHTDLNPQSALRLLIGGSSLRTPDAASAPHNECTVFDRIGRVLWRQCKIDPYAMEARKMAQYGVSPLTSKPHMELAKAGDTLAIRESATLGRMLVLICEDLAQDSPGKRVRRELVPDWIFVPILDGSIEPGRWVHQEALEASKLRCRVIVTNSMTLAAREAKTNAIGSVCASTMTYPADTTLLLSTEGPGPHR